MGSAWGDKARQLIDSNPSNASCCFVYSKVLLDLISLSLKEEGTTMETCNESLAAAIQANPFAAWMIAYNDIFQGAFEQTESIEMNSTTFGSIEDAIEYVQGKFQSLCC